uniref:FIP-RBD domain-containing protein n=1 Tax=Rhabditophanes sp. KR3021 TaxID=114890 RepID=A0AC35TVP1_9BILA
MSELGTRENPFELPQPQVDGPFEYPQQQINLSNNNTRDLDTCNVPVVELPQLVNLSVNDVSDLDTSNVLAEPTLLGNVFINKEEILTKDKSEINKGVCTSLGSGICQQIDVEFFDEAEQWRQLYITSQKQLEEANTKLSNIHCFYKNKNEQTKNEKLLDLKKIEQPLMARKKDFESNSIAMNGKDKALFKAKFKIDELERQLNNLEDRNNANIYELEADLAKLQKESQAEITELKDDLAKLQKESQAKITELENKLGQSIFSNSSSNSSGESLIQAQTRITELEEENKTMTTNSNQITELQAQNTKLQSEKNSFERNVKALENTITTLQAAIENVTNEKSVSMQYLQTNLNELRMENEALKNSDLKNRAVLRGKDNLITKMLAGSSGQSINPNPCQQPKIAKVVTAEGLDLTDYQDIDKIKYITNTNLTESEVIKLYLDFGKNVNEVISHLTN